MKFPVTQCVGPVRQVPELQCLRTSDGHEECATPCIAAPALARFPVDRREAVNSSCSAESAVSMFRFDIGSRRLLERCGFRGLRRIQEARCISLSQGEKCQTSDLVAPLPLRERQEGLERLDDISGVNSRAGEVGRGMYEAAVPGGKRLISHGASVRKSVTDSLLSGCPYDPCNCRFRAERWRVCAL